MSSLEGSSLRLACRLSKRSTMALLVILGAGGMLVHVMSDSSRKDSTELRPFYSSLEDGSLLNEIAPQQGIDTENELSKGSDENVAGSPTDSPTGETPINATAMTKQISCTASRSTAWINCHPDANADMKTCSLRRCCWLLDPSVRVSTPCVMPLSNVRYVVANRTWTEHGTRLLLDLVQLGVGLQGESSRLNADVIRFSHGTARLRIYDPSKTEFEPPVPKIAAAESTEDVGYRMGLDKSGAMFIVPKGTEHITFVVHLESLFYADDVKQLAVRVPSARMLYGLRGPDGATFVKAHQSSRHAFYRPFNSDDSANHEFNSGVHPFVVIYTGVGKVTLGLFLLNSDDVDLTWSEKGVATFRTSGGVLDLFMFVGPSPQSVVKQYLRVVGFPAMPSPTLVRMGVPRTLLLRLDGGINPESFGYVEATLPVRDPAFPPVVMRASGKERYQCKKPGNETLEIVDFTHPSGMHLWLESLRSHISSFPNLVLLLQNPLCSAEVDGADSSRSSRESQQFAHVPGATKLYLSTYAHLQNVYVALMARSTYRSLANKILMKASLLSTTTFPGIGRWSGYWDPVLAKDFTALSVVIQDMLVFNMMGIPVYGTDTCRLVHVTNQRTADACSQLAFLAAFLPLQHPREAVFEVDKPPTQSEALKLRFWRASERASLLRSRLMPYTLTTLFKSSRDGTMLARPMYFEFPDDLKTHAYTAQFMYGPCVLVAPFLNPPNSSTKVKEVYLPEGVWYMYPAGRRIASTGGAVYVPALSDGAGAVITRGGSIIPYAADTRKVSDATTSTRPGSIGLAVSLDADEQATGEFFLMPEGNGGLEAVPSGKYSLFHFVYVKGTLMGHCSVCGMAMTLEGVQIFGLSRSTSSVDINGSPLKFSVSDSVLETKEMTHTTSGPFVITVV